MAIHFELKLSTQAIDCLFSLATWIEQGQPKEPTPFLKYSHFLTHIGVLKREGLIEGGPEWAITKKGYLVIDLLKEEFEELRRQHSLLAEATKRTKRIGKG